MSKKFVTFLASAGLILVTMIWGFAFVVVKNTLDAIPPIWMMAFRFTIGAIVLSLIFINRFKKMNRQTLKHGFLIGIWLFLAYAFQTIGCNYTTAGKNAFLTTVYVVLVPFINWALVKNKPDKYSVIAAFLSITGIGLLSLEGDLSVNIGDVLTLICGICYAMQIIYIARYSQGDDPILLAILQIGLSAVLSWITAPVIDGAFPPVSVLTDKVVIGSILYLGLGSTMICFLLQTVCQKYLEPSLASLLMSFESVFGMLSSVIFMHEILSGRNILGCVLMFVAVVLGETKLSFLKKKR